MYELKQQGINHYILKLTTHKYSKILVSSIIKLFQNSYYNKDTQSIHFICENIITFSDYLKNNNFKLSEQKCIQIISDLYKHYTNIIKENYGLYGIDIQDIIMIDEMCIFISPKYILPLQHSRLHSNILTMTLFEPLISIPYFSSPEIINITVLPATIRTECFYYTLASFIVYCLTNKYIFEGNDVKSFEEINMIIHTIKFGKLFWFLERCLHPNPEERKCFLI